MSVSLVPYHGGMRVGQGINSYTQELRLADAVAWKTTNPGGDHYGYDEPNAAKLGQTVSYSSRFVDRLSEVTTAMGISGSVCIKSGTIGGSANGNFVDAEKFKESDVNYFIQSKVTNQTIQSTDNLDFKPLADKNPPADPGAFTEIYGDSFISGFVEGGELDILVSVKVPDKAQIPQVRSYLEGKLGSSSAQTSSNLHAQRRLGDYVKGLETTIIVNWLGGGDLLPEDGVWVIEMLPTVAATFPFKVAHAPQRTYAILSSYLTLRTFRAAMPGIRPLDYSKASLHVSALLDEYIEYKLILKNIKLMTDDLTDGEISLDPSRPSSEVQRLIMTFNKNNSLVNGNEKPNFEPYGPTMLSLAQARSDCEAVIFQIVDEVNAIAADPQLVEDITKTSRFLPADAFRQLVPVGDVVTNPRKNADSAEIETSTHSRVPKAKPRYVSFENGTLDYSDEEEELMSPNPKRSSRSPRRSSEHNHRGHAEHNHGDHVHHDLESHRHDGHPSHGHGEHNDEHVRRDHESGHMPHLNGTPEVGRQRGIGNGSSTQIPGRYKSQKTSSDLANGGSTAGKTSCYVGSKPLFPAAITSAHSQPAHKADRFRMSYYAGDERSSDSSTFFNDLELLDSSSRLKEVQVWWSPSAVVGLRTRYADGREMSHGTSTARDSSSSVMKLTPGEEIIGVKLFAATTRHVQDKDAIFAANSSRSSSYNSSSVVRAIACIRLVTSHAEVMEFWDPHASYENVRTLYEMAPGPGWSLRGFYGEESARIDRLGMVWGLAEKGSRTSQEILY